MSMGMGTAKHTSNKVKPMMGPSKSTATMMGVGTKEHKSNITPCSAMPSKPMRKG